MSHAMTGSDGGLMGAAGRSDLRARIGWICHGLRIAAVIWVGWILVMVLIVWTDKASVLEAYGRLLSTDLSSVSNLRYLFAVALVLLSWAAAAAVAFCLWRLFGTYLAGRVFTVDAVTWLRRIGIAGIVAVMAGVLIRLAIIAVFSGQIIPAAGRSFLVLPQDLLNLIFAVFVLALAHIFRAAAEMAEDHAQIV